MKPDSRPITGSSVAAVLRRELGAGMTLRALGASGFCATWRAEAADARWFVKSAPAASRDLLAAEADGLAALAATATVRVPPPPGHGAATMAACTCW
jgi:fructosamine-3-kinase